MTTNRIAFKDLPIEIKIVTRIHTSRYITDRNGRNNTIFSLNTNIEFGQETKENFEKIAELISKGLLTSEERREFISLHNRTGRRRNYYYNEAFFRSIIEYNITGTIRTLRELEGRTDTPHNQIRIDHL